MATVNSTQVAHDNKATDYEAKYNEATDRLEAQKQLCDKCKLAEDALIAALSAANTKHTTAQTKSDELVAAETAYSTAKSAWEAKHTAFANKKADLKCPALTVDDDASAFTAASAIVDELRVLAGEETALEADMTTKEGLRNTAQTDYNTAASEASGADAAVTTTQTTRTTDCAGVHHSLRARVRSL